MLHDLNIKCVSKICQYFHARVLTQIFIFSYTHRFFFSFFRQCHSVQYMMKCTAFACTDALMQAALLSDFASLRFTSLCIRHTMMTVGFFSSHTSFCRRRALQPAFRKKISASPTVEQNEKSLTTVCLSLSTDSPYAGS